MYKMHVFTYDASPKLPLTNIFFLISHKRHAVFYFSINIIVARQTIVSIYVMYWLLIPLDVGYWFGFILSNGSHPKIKPANTHP